MSSISNPFFDPIPPPLASPRARHSSTGQKTLFNCAGAAAASDQQNGNGMEKREQENGGSKNSQQQQKCCVANPFTEEGSGQFERQMSQSVMDSMLYFSSEIMTASCSQPVPHPAKILQDSGYRSTTSNSALEEELAAVERERREERQRRRQQKRKGRGEEKSGLQNDLEKNSSVPAFLRRTCSTAASSAISAIRPMGMATTSLLAAADDVLKRKVPSGPRRTRSVGSNRSIMTNTTDPLPTAFLYSTGWMVEAELSGDDAHNEKAIAEKDDCAVELSGNRRVGIQRLHELLLTRFCFISGLHTQNGHPIITFPDSRTTGLNFEDYQLMLDYLMQTHRDEELPSSSSSSVTQHSEPEWVIIVDRRQDRWSSVRTVFSFLLNYFPQQIHLIFLLKPEGVLQRAIELGYRGLLESCEKFRVLICQNFGELHDFLEPSSLTMDIGGPVRHNHLEWLTHRIDIERMKSSARVIAESLSEFGKCLRETELPNDVQSTARILELQAAERDAIKEDFRISIRKGMQLLRQVRQLDQNPMSEQLSPSRLQNLVAIERMIAQLQDTEKSFDTFWQKHRQRLLGCLELRRFEDEFRKLQNCFAKHMLHLEDHPDVGNSEASVERLSIEHENYREVAEADVFGARKLRERGLELDGKELAELLQGSDSVGPKCEELTRMADALEGALAKRSKVLELSRAMHAQIGKANDWCRRGVELLSIAPLDLLSAGCSNNLAIYEHALSRLEDFIAEGDSLKMDAFVKAQQKEDLILLTSTDTSSLLAQVNERIDDIRRLSRARQEALQKLSAERRAQFDSGNGTERRISSRERPIQVVSPEKSAQQKTRGSQARTKPSPAYHQFSDHPHDKFRLEQQQSQKERNTSSPSTFDQALIRANSAESPCTCNPSTIEKRGENLAKVHFVLDELVSTECNYVKELGEILFNYVQPFEALELAGNSNQIPSALRGQADILFGNIHDLYEFHHSLLLPAFEQNSDSVEGISAVLSNPNQRQRLLALYRNFCRNKQVSESLRSEHGVDQNKFFMECQRRAGHLLPLSAYLLKPVQRITKYQLLLKELIRHCTGAQLLPVQSALSSMLDLLAQINADMEQLHILGYPGDLRLLGPLRLQTECEVFVYKRAKSSSLGSNGGGAVQTGINGGGTRRGTKGKHQKRHLFLFDGGVLFCKKRVQSVQFASEYYEHKFCIHIASLGFAECSRHSEDRFELWDQSDCCSYAIQPTDERARPKWIQKLARLTVLHHHHQQQQRVAAEAAAQTISDTHKMGQQSPTLIIKTARPQSWTTTSSSEDGNIASCSTSIHSCRSSTSSATAFEEKCQQPTTIIDGHLIQSATEPTFKQNDDEDKNELLNDEQQRSKSQPPEISMTLERQKKGNGKKLVNRL